MAQETTTVKRCETCGRISACPSLRRGKVTDMRSMKMEDTPGFCGQWISTDYAYAKAAGVTVVVSSAPIPVLPGQLELIHDTSSGAAAPPSPQGEGSELSVAEARELGRIEARIETAKRQTMVSLLEIGRCLNEAKDRNLVPHGQFEDWATEQTGINERTRQRIMQAAREIPSGSAMERLEFTKAIALLALPEGDREAAAEKAAEKKTPLRQLQLEVSKLTRKLDEAAEAAKRDKERDQQRIDDKDAYIKTLTNQVKDGEDSRLALQAAKDEIKELKAGKDVDALRAGGAAMENPEVKAVLDAHAKTIAKLRQDKADAEQYAEEQAALRQDAQQEMLMMKSQAAHGQPVREEGLTCESLAEAVRVFLGSAGVLPHMGKILCELSAAEREKFQRNVAMLAGWVEGSRRALDMVAGEVTIGEEG